MMKVLVICSGGIDSVAMAALNKYTDLVLMTFDYGQKGRKEMGVVSELAKTLNAKFISVDISFLKDMYGDTTQLTSDEVVIEDEYAPSVVVPLRNAMFLQVAMVYAYTYAMDKVVLGSHMDDVTEVDGERLFPDCSPEFFKAFELAMDLGTFRREGKVEIETASTLGLGKSDLVRKGFDILGHFMFKTWSCYLSGEKHCGVCEACQNRKKAWAVVDITDGTEYEDEN